MDRILNRLKPDNSRATLLLAAGAVAALLLLGVLVGLLLHLGRRPAVERPRETPFLAMDLVRPIRPTDIIVPPLGIGRPDGDVYLFSDPDTPWPRERTDALRIDTDAISADILRDMNEALLRELLDLPPP